MPGVIIAGDAGAHRNGVERRKRRDGEKLAAAAYSNILCPRRAALRVLQVPARARTRECDEHTAWWV